MSESWFNNDALRGKSLLIVDDYPDNLVLIKAYLANSGLSIDTAENGIEALNMAKLRDYDVIVMDFQMPDLNGEETAAVMRMRGLCAPIVACTAIGTLKNLPGEPTFNAFLAKPLVRTDLYKCLERLI